MTPVPKSPFKESKMNRKMFLLLSMTLAVSCVSLAQNRPGLLGKRPANRGASAAAAQQETQQPMSREDLKSVPRGTNGVPALAFNQADVALVLEAYADEVGKTVIPAPDLPKAQITLRSLEGQILTKEEYLEAIELVLTMNGIVLEPRGKKFLRALPRKTVRTHGIPLKMEDKGNLPEQGRVVSQMIAFKNIEVAEAQKALEGFKAPEGLFQVFERTNAILVTDTQENINRMLEIARVIDVATPVTEDVFVRQIEYALAQDIKTHLETIVTESQKDTQQKQSGPKPSGAPGFGSSTPSSLRTSLLNLNNRPGMRKPEQPVNTPNANLIAAVSDADRGMIRGKVLILADERSNKLIIITNKSNMDFFDRVIKTLDVETTPEVQIEVIRLKYAEAEDVEQMLNELIGASSSSSQSKNNQNANTQKGGAANSNLTRGTTQSSRRQSTNSPTFQNVNASRLGELSKENVKVLADKRINGVVIMARRADMRAIREVIDNMDVKLSQVLIETVIIEVSLGDNLKTGIDWVMGGNVAQNVFMNHGQMIGGGAGSTKLADFATSGINASVATNLVTPVGAGINYLFKSDKLNLAGVIEASKTDSRSKYVASPIVMTVDNEEATIEATSSRQFLTGWSAVSSTYAGSGLPSPNYSAKDIGITLKITPKINPNGTVMLEVEEEYSQVSGTQDMLTPMGSTYTTTQIDVPVTRKMSANISLENGQSVILGGLTTKDMKNSEVGIPLLKDIPYIGKWLFGSVKQEESRSELLIFMTPYVLDDSDAAQMEAMRRKKTLSDPRPWDDGGWSASPIADPVSQKERLRRFKEEWAKQDEERRTKLAIEKAKVDRAKKLEGMSDAERKFWLELHRDELEKERREEFDRQAKEQADLKEFVEEIKKKDLEKAEAEIKKAESEAKKATAAGGENAGFIGDLKTKPQTGGEAAGKQGGNRR